MREVLRISIEQLESYFLIFPDLCHEQNIQMLKLSNLGCAGKAS